MTPERAAAVRTIASSLVFDQDPPVLRSLDKAKRAAAEIVDALVAAHILAPAYALAAEVEDDDAPAVLVAAGVNGEVADVQF